jgi:uncharacterized membrane protein YkvA (DUF1232 family)
MAKKLIDTKNTPFKNKVLMVLSGVFVGILGLVYLINSLDAVPDGLGAIGYLDDAIVLILMFLMGRRVYRSLSGKIRASRATSGEFWRKRNFVQIVTSGKFWKVALISAGAIGYFVWTADLFPDVLAGGLIDDAIIALGALITFWRNYR